MATGDTEDAIFRGVEGMDGAAAKAPRRGAHRKKRERMPLPGMMIHQDGSSHEWAAGQMWDLIVTMDDAAVLSRGG